MKWIRRAWHYVIDRPLAVTAVVAIAAAAFAGAATASPPTTVTAPTEYTQTFAAGDGLCSFDVTFTGLGTVTMTTYYDNSGQPIRASIHGALVHTVSSAWHTLSSNGPAPVHFDLSSGLATDTGKEFAFHLPGSGVVWAQNGRFVFGDIGVVAYSGLNTLDTAALCAALAPA